MTKRIPNSHQLTLIITAITAAAIYPVAAQKQLDRNPETLSAAAPEHFRDDFNGTTLNRDSWQVATWSEHGGQTGSERVFVKDGFLNLVLVNDLNKGILSSALQTTQKYGFGRWEARLKPSNVPGVLNSMYTIDWDDPSTPNKDGDGTKQEIDIEFLTKTFRQNTGEMHAAVHAAGRKSMNTNPDLRLNFNPSSDFHVYGFDILPDRIDWLIDGKVVHTYKYAGNAITINSSYNLKFNVWTARDWIGGPPAPGVKSIYVIDWIRFIKHK